MSQSTNTSNVVSIDRSTGAGAIRAVSTASSTGGEARYSRSGSEPPSGGLEVEIGKLQTHVRWIERGLTALAACLLALAGMAWHGYDALTGSVTKIAVDQEGFSGKIDTLDAKLSGKFDVIAQRLDDASKNGASRQAK